MHFLKLNSWTENEHPTTLLHRRHVTTSRPDHIVCRSGKWPFANTCYLYLGCVPPLIEEALRLITPVLSVFCFSWPCSSQSLLNIIPPEPCIHVSAFPHLLFGLPLNIFPSLTCHSVHLTVHLFCFIRATCPTNFYFSFIFLFCFFYLVSIFCILSIVLFLSSLFHFSITFFQQFTNN